MRNAPARASLSSPLNTSKQAPGSPQQKNAPSGAAQSKVSSQAPETSQQKRRPSGVAQPSVSSQASEAPPQKRLQRRPSSDAQSSVSPRKSINARSLTRKLSFVDCSIGQIQSAIQAEDPDYVFNTEFWNILLSENPPLEAQPLKNRTLTFWITFFNMWQALGDWRPGCAPKTINGIQLGALMPMAKVKQIGILQLFDPAGLKRLQSQGFTDSVLKKVAIDAGALMTAGVMLSQVISSKHKLDLIFGIVAVNDNKSFEEHEFVEFIRNFIIGLGAAFGILGQKDIFPAERDIKLVATRLYSRISAISARRLHELLATHDPAVIHAIHEAAQSKLGRPHSAPAASLISSTSSHAKTARQLVPMSALREWCHSKSGDPLAVPYNLIMERYCPSRQGNDIADEFDDIQLNVSHTSPLPELASEEFCGKLLSRTEVKQAHYIFEHCHAERSFDWRWRELESKLQLRAEKSTQDMFGEALRMAHRARFHVNFFDFLRFLCPGAQPKHLRMFDSWRQECIQITESQTKVAEMKQLTEWYTEQSAKPVLPPCELHALELEFRRIDRSGNGIIELEELASAWGWNVADTKEHFNRYDVLVDGSIDFQEFLIMMCPCKYRLPDESVSGREAVAKLLSGQTSAQQESIRNMQRKFTGEGALVKMPADLMPEVDDATWKMWIKIYEGFDKNRDGNVSLSELEYAGIFNKENSGRVLLEVTNNGEACFSRQSFLGAMLAVHGYRRSGFAVEAMSGG